MDAQAGQDGGRNHGAAADGVQDPVLADKEPMQIVRATSRMRINFDRMPEEAAKSFRAALYEGRRMCVTGANRLCRQFRRMDEDALDVFLKEHGRLPKLAKEWPAPQLPSWGYQLVRQAVPELSSGIASALSKAVSDKWRQDRWETFIQQKRQSPHYRETLPIPVREQDYRVLKVEDGWAVGLSLRSGTGNRFQVPIDVRDAFQKRALDALFAGRWKPGALAIQQDPKRPSRWYVRIAYKRRVLATDAKVTMAINRGIHCHLVAVTGAGDIWRYDGNDIVAYLKQIQARRQQYQRDAKACGRGGRGRRRILRPIAPLIAKGERWRETKCQTIARRLANWAKDRGVGVVYMEDFEGIRRGEPERMEGGERVWRMVQEWPYYQQGMRLRSCLEELGIAVETRPACYHSQRCPACGVIDEKHRDLKKWRLSCDSCGYSRDLDEASCSNSLARAADPEAAWAKEPPAGKKAAVKKQRRYPG